MINVDVITNKNRTNPNWSKFTNHWHIILAIGASGSGKINAVINADINYRKQKGLKQFEDSKVLTKYSNSLNDIQLLMIIG